MLVGGLAVRVITMLGFPPAIWFGGDSESYLSTAIGLHPGISRLSGYAIMLDLLRPFHSFAVVTAVQHLMGLAAAVMLYALLRRYGLPGWGATLATLPILADAYQLELEQEILPSAAFGFLVLTALTLILWWRDDRPMWATVAAAGILGIASIFWPVGLPLLIILFVYLIVRRAGWRVLVAAAVTAAVPLVGYLAWFDVNYHQVAFNDSDGIYLWSRTMTFANCAIIKPPADERALCPGRPVARRPAASTFIWEGNSPLKSVPGSNFSPAKNALAMDFARRAIIAQPTGYLHDVLDDFLLNFTWNKPTHPSVKMTDRYQFAFATNAWIDQGSVNGQALARNQRSYTHDGTSWTKAVQPYAGWMRGYQRFVTLRGTILAVLLLVGMAGIARSWAGGGFRRLSGWGGPALYPWVTGLAMLLVPTATADFSQRYALPATSVVLLAAALAVAPRGAGRRYEAAGVPAAADPPAAVAGAGPPLESGTALGSGTAVNSGAELADSGAVVNSGAELSSGPAVSSGPAEPDLNAELNSGAEVNSGAAVGSPGAGERA